MKICLVRCPSPFLIDDKVFPPLGLMSVGTVLKKGGHDVTIADGFLPYFDFYGFGPTTPEYPFAKLCLSVIKKYNPKARVIIGGAHATLNPKLCLKDGFDCVVTEDGEPAVEEAFFGHSSLVVGGEDHSLDDYPIIDRAIIDLKRYIGHLNGKPVTTLVTSQGCPFKCAFCCKNYKKVRFRSVSKVIEEIEMLHYDFGYEALAFPEDLFILNRERTETICACLKDLGITWRCLVRADLVVKYGSSFMKMMADSGCIDASMGIESGSDKILANIDKCETTATMRTAIQMIKDVGIKAKGFIILGLPGETRQTLAETDAFLNEVKLDGVDVKIYQPYPGTPIWDNHSSYDIQWNYDDGYENMFYKGRLGDYRGSLRTSSLTTEQIVKAWIELESTYKHAC